MSRFFQVPAGIVLTLPLGLIAGPGATVLRLENGASFTVDDARAVSFGRFIAGRLRGGDLVELAGPPADGVAPTVVASVDSPITTFLGLTAPALPENG